MQTDVVLLKASMTPAMARTLTEDQLGALMDQTLSGSRISMASVAGQSTDQVLCYAYAKPSSPGKISKKQRAKLQKAWRKLTGDKHAMVCRLVRALECPGASSGKGANVHYVVETDTDKGWFKEIAAWYDTEHMPGLAAVPGTIHAVRFINLDDGPRSVAVYDLEHQDVMGSPQWLAVRATAWSSHCRPHFRNTIRTMFQVLG